MTYVMAGLYGELDKYREMMKKIAFGKEDILYVLGDMVDYGAESIPLFTIEKKQPAAEMDVLGFTLQYELSFTNILNMLDLAGIPLLSSERGEEWPVIAAGGGGIPVLPQNEELKGASAVIEKDLTSGLMAEMLNADMLMILTSVENVSINYGTPDEKPLEHITVADAKKYIAEGQFGENSMLPKMEAAVSFLEKGIGRTAVITSIDSALAGFQGKTGTIIE